MADGKIRYKNKNPEDLKKYTLIKQFKDSWKYSIGFRTALVAALIMSIISGFLAVAPSFLYGKIVGDLTNQKFNLITIYLIILAISYVLFHLAGRVIDRVLYINNLESRNATRVRIYNFLFSLGFDFFEKHPSGSLMNQLNEGVGDFTRFTKQFYRIFLISLFSFIFALIMLVYLQPMISIIGGITMAVYLLWARLTDYKKLKLEYDVSLTKDQEQSKIHDFLGHIQLVKLLNLKDNLIREMKKAQAIIIDKEKLSRNYMNRVVFVQKNILDLSLVIVLAILSYAVIRGSSNIGVAVTIYALYTKFISEFKTVRDQYNELLNTRVGMVKLARLWDNKVSIKEPEHPKKIKSWKEIKFDNVSFKYHGKIKSALNKLSFSVKKGEKLAIVGLSGSGKSTISKLLFRMYLPDEGSIKIGNVDIKDVNSLNLYDLMKIVPQENELINATIYENLKFGTSEKVSKEEIMDSLKKAHAIDFVRKLPNKINTFVGPNGIKLSGGEKQRLCIARALLSKPEILVLDEATSHLDVLTEKKIHDSIHHFGKEQTVIAITHRISSMYLFDRIIVLDNGRITGQGTHDQLLKTNQQYQELWRQSKVLK